MWKGVTDFLETMDERVASYAAQDGQGPPAAKLPSGAAVETGGADEGAGNKPPLAHEALPVAVDDDDWNGTSDMPPPAAAASDAVGRVTPPARFPEVPGSSSGPGVEALQRQLVEERRAAERAAAAHEQAQQERDRAFLALQADYDAVSAQNRALAVEVQHRGSELADERASRARLEERFAELETLQHTTAAEVDGLKEQLASANILSSDLTLQIEAAAREAAAERAARARADDAAAAAHGELEQYKIKTRVALEEKSAIIARLEQQQAPGPEKEAQPDVSVIQAQLTLLQVSSEELQTRLRAAEEKQRRAQEEAKEAAAAVSAKESLITQLQALAAQLREESTAERASREAEVRGLKYTLTEKERFVTELERRVKQLQDQLGSSSSNPGERKGGEALSPETEKRIRELAEMVMDKQAALEAKRAEADSWRTRYEVSQQRLREAEIAGQAVRPQTLGATTTTRRARTVDAEGGSELFRDSSLYGMLQSRGDWGQRVSTVAEGIDKVSLKAASLLRSSSLLRIALICYVVGLQLYAFFLTSIIGVAGAPRDSGDMPSPK